MKQRKDANPEAEDLKKIKSIHPLLKKWFESNQRALPWRKRYDPYSVWISEIMLQQTSVKAVIDYYNRWMNRFPDIETLNRATEDEALKLWEGLGYYSRCGNLKATAKRIIDEYSGIFPQEREKLLCLPGVGEYTAGAIMNISFRLPAPMVDGNVSRVLARIFDWPESIETSLSRKFFNSLTKKLFEEGAPRLLSQSLMELGALICGPSRIQCPLCPVSAHCLSYKNNTIQSRPVKKKRTPSIPLVLKHYVHKSSEGYLLLKIQDGNWWKRLWCFPWCEESEKDVFEKKHGISARAEWAEVAHSITKYKVRSKIVICDKFNSFSQNPDCVYKRIKPKELRLYSLSKPAAMIREKLINSDETS